MCIGHFSIMMPVGIVQHLAFPRICKEGHLAILLCQLEPQRDQHPLMIAQISYCTHCVATANCRWLLWTSFLLVCPRKILHYSHFHSHNGAFISLLNILGPKMRRYQCLPYIIPRQNFSTSNPLLPSHLVLIAKLSCISNLLYLVTTFGLVLHPCLTTTSSSQAYHYAHCLSTLNKVYL